MRTTNMVEEEDVRCQVEMSTKSEATRRRNGGSKLDLRAEAYRG